MLDVLNTLANLPLQQIIAPLINITTKSKTYAYNSPLFSKTRGLTTNDPRMQTIKATHTSLDPFSFKKIIANMLATIGTKNCKDIQLFTGNCVKT